MKQVFLFVTSTLYSFSIAQNCQHGWDLLLNNKFKEAKTEFTKLSQDTSLVSEANIGLLYLSEIEELGQNNAEYFYNSIKNTRDPNPFAYTLWNKVFNGGLLNEKKVQILNELEQYPNVNYYVKNLIETERSRPNYIKGELKDFVRNQKANNDIFEWQVLGPFENYAGSGYNVNTEAINHPEATYEFKSNYGAPIKWFNTIQNRNFSQIRFYEHFDNLPIIAYSQTFCKSPKKQKVILNFICEGSIKIWINDALVYQQQEEKEYSLGGIWLLPVDLNEGYNRILVQIGSGIINGMSLDVSLEGMNGEVLEDLEFTTSNQAYNKQNGELLTNLQPVFSEIYFKNRNSKNPSDIVTQLLLTDTYINTQKAEEGLNSIKNLEAQYQNSYLLNYLKSQIYNLQNNRVNFSECKEKLKEINPNTLSNLYKSFEEELGNKNYNKSKEYLTKIEETYPTFENIDLLRMELAASKGDYELLNTLIEKAYDKNPNEYAVVFAKSTLLKKQNKNDQAIKLMKKYLKSNYSNKLYGELIEEYANQNKYYEMESSIQEMIKYEPLNTNLYQILANYYYAMRQYSRADKYIAKITEIAPYSSDSWFMSGKSYEQQKETTKALESFNKALLYNPKSYNTLEKIRELENKKTLFELLGEKEIEEEYSIVKSQSTDNIKGYKLVFLLDKKYKIVYKNGLNVTKNYVIVKVLTQEGVDGLKEIETGADEIEKALLFKKNGKMMQAEIYGDKLVFPNLEIGDVVAYLAKDYSYSSGKLASNFWDVEPFSLGNPMLNKEYKLLIDNDLPLKYQFSVNPVKPTESTLENFKLYEFVSKDIQGYKDEPLMPNTGYDYQNIAHFSTFKNWDEVAKWYYEIASEKFKPSFEIKQLAKEIIPNPNIDQLSKAKLLFNWITKNIRYSSVPFRQSGLVPQYPKKLISDKMGDCKDVSTLFVALSNEIGLKSNLVLVSTRSQGENKFLLPSIDFNHCIAKVEISGKEYFLELTNDNIPFGCVTTELMKANVLEIKNDIACNLFKLKSSTGPLAKIKRITDYSLNKNELTVKKNNRKYGESTISTRNVYEELNKEEQEKELLSSIVDDYSDAKLVVSTFDGNLLNNADSLSYSYTFTVANALTDAGGIDLLKIKPTDKIVNASVVSSSERAFDIYFYAYAPNIEEEFITLSLPADKKLLKTPENKLYKTDFADYELKFELKGNVLKITRLFTPKLDIIPKARYAEFKDFIEKIVKADDINIALQ